MSRLFLSHSSVDDAAALALAQWLEQKGWGDYYLDFDARRGIAPGERWIAALAAAVDRCEAVIFLVSPAWRRSEYCFAEFFEAKKLGKRIFGVMVEPMALEDLPTPMTAEWQLCDLTRGQDLVEFRVAMPPIVNPAIVRFPREGLERLALGLQRAGLDASTFVWPPFGDPGRSPYPGLRALDEADAAVFFGRDAHLVRAIDQIRLVRERGIEHLFVILGASGAGKSSFLRAGLLPRLRRDPERFFVLPTIRPENAVLSGSGGLLDSLKTALAAAGHAMSAAQVGQQLNASGLQAMIELIATAKATARFSDTEAAPLMRTAIIPIDQAEELFSTDGRQEAGQFLALVEALRGPTSMTGQVARTNILFVLTIRSDALPALQEQAAIQALSPFMYSLPAMPATEFKAVIEGPAKRHTETVRPLSITSELADRLVREAQGADALPLLALTLEWLYREFDDAKAVRIGAEEYESLGGMRGVIGKSVDRAFERPDRQPAIPRGRIEREALLGQLFPFLATVDPDSGNYKRLVAPRNDIRGIPQARRWLPGSSNAGCW